MFLSNPTKLAELQDLIISKSHISTSEAKKLISELFKFSDIINNRFLGLNAVAENNLAIRYHFIQAALHKISGNIVRSETFSKNAFYLLTNYIVNGFYTEGYSYFKYVEQSYNFFIKYCPDKTLSVFKNIDSSYLKIASPDGRIPSTDTHFSDIVSTIFSDMSSINSYYSAHKRNKTYVLINHFNKLNEFSKNLHINYEFGHFCLFTDGDWKILHPWYPGFNKKINSSLRNSWNNNIIINGVRTLEPVWRYVPFKPKLTHTYFSSFGTEKIDNHQFEIGNITRSLAISEHVITVQDNGGEYSSFNLSDDCQFNVMQASKVIETKGFHADGNGEIQQHKRLKVYGKERKTVFLF